MEGLFNQIMTHLSVVVPLFNESALVKELVKRIIANVKLITEDFEIILVDDGSQDTTWDLIGNECKNESRLKGIKFSRNFGHHFAITAGLHNAKGDWIVVMDGDLQDRPEVIQDLYDKAVSGFDVVFVSRENRPEKMYYLILQKLFYTVLNGTSGITFDSRQANFSIINQKVLAAFKDFPDSARFYGSTIKWLGFKRSSISATHGNRFAGRPSYTFKKRLKLASDIITSFSERPLNFSIVLGFTAFTLINLYSFLNLINSKLKYTSTVFTELEKFSTTVFTFLFGLILLILGIFGLYMKSIFLEVKKRPLYIIADSLNI